MAAGAIYGIFLAAVMFILTTFLPAALGWMFFWAGVAVQLAIGAAVVWRRTALPAMTVAFLWGAGTAAVFALMSWRGLLLEQLWGRAPVLTSASVLIAPVLMFSESWLHPAQWQGLKRAADQSSFLDVLTFRHIPDLRVNRPTKA